jgi:dimethylamine monooxygenase subunit A
MTLVRFQVGAPPNMLEHLTLDAGPYAMKMHVRALAPGCLIDVDPERYRHELTLKADILAADDGYYYQVLPGTEDLQWETLEVLLPNMALHYPHWFGLGRTGDRWSWTNRLLGTNTAFKLGDPTTLPLPPLDWVGRQVQEDLCLMDGNAPDTPLVAGHLCFGSGWCLNDKMGASFLAIHGPVPGFEPSIGRSAQLMMQRLRADRPTARVNWTIHPSDRLNCAPALKRQYAFEQAGLTPANAGQRYFLRSEWQTFARYPRTRAVVFTIRTRVRSLADALTTGEDARRLAALLRSMPPELLDYKSLTNHLDVLLAWLDAQTSASDATLSQTLA